MAEWRERGYVPDSDEEEEDSYGHANQEVGAPQEVERHSGSLDTRDSRHELEEPSCEQEEKHSSSVLTADAEKGLSHAGTAPYVNEQELFMTSSSLGERKAPNTHDKAPGDVDDFSTSTPVARQLHATLSLGLKQVSEVLGEFPGQSKKTATSSQSSSPLSSIGSLEDELGKQFDVTEPPPRSARREPNEPSIGQHVQQTPVRYSLQRTLRQRTQIQLHPYALEDARYQQELKARGLKPVKIVNVHGQEQQGLAQSAEDEASLFSSSPVDHESAPWPLNASLDLDPMYSEELDQAISQPRMDDDDEDEDLPDLAKIFSANAVSTKMTKAAESSVPNRDRAKIAEQYKAVDVTNPHQQEEIRDYASSERANFFVPPSPPNSGTASASDCAEIMQNREREQGATPGRLPTPLLSSETHPGKRRCVYELSDSSQDVSRDVSDADTDAESPPSSKDGKNSISRIKALRRKIKGVLPASWLKLDLKKQTVTDKYQRNFQSARELLDGKGIAKPLSTARAQTGVALPSSNSPEDAPYCAFPGDDISSGDEMDSEHDDYRNLDANVLDNDLMDVPEYDRIDTMQSTKARQSNSVSKPRKRRQQRISGTWQKVSERSEHGVTSGESHRIRENVPRKAPRAKRRRQYKPAPRLSVLDAPSFVSGSMVKQPQYLKVISRRAQKETRKMTQSPGSKFLRLETEWETKDINQTLEHWQNGHIHPHHQDSATVSKIGPDANRSLLLEAKTDALSPGNFDKSSQASPTAVSGLAALKNSTDATIQRLLFKRHGLPISSSAEVAFTTSPSRVRANLARLCSDINLCKPLQNRSGLGSLQKAATRPRVAQLEGPMPARPSTSSLWRLASTNLTNDQSPNRVNAVGSLEGVPYHEEQLDTTKQQPTSTSKPQRRRKPELPHRKRPLLLKEACDSEPTADSSIARNRDRTSDEANVVVDLMNMISKSTGVDARHNGWSLLWSPLQRWLEMYADKGLSHMPSDKKRAKEIFKWCNELVLEHRWPTASDDLIRKAAWFFSKLGMIDPFDSQTTPRLGLPPFLDELTSTMSLAPSGFGDSTFHIFLNMLAITLSEKSIDVTSATSGLVMDKKKKIELQSFVNRLYPNNGRLLSEQEEVRKVHLASLWNRSSLYLTLYCYNIEDCRPRLSQIQSLVDFSQSHIKACEVILAVWAVLACFHARKTETCQYHRLAELSEWLQSMILRMLTKWIDARSEVEQQLGGCAMDVRAVYVVETNRSSVESFLEQALKAWAVAVEKCETQNTAVQILADQQLEQTLRDLAVNFNDNNTVLKHMLDVIDQYFHKHDTASILPGSAAHFLVLVIFRTIDDLLTRRFGSEGVKEESGITRVINRQLTYNWYLVASNLIEAKDKAWDDFLEPAGKCAWERFTNAKRSAQYKTLFVSHVLKASDDVYWANKFWYLSYWLRALLLPTNEWVFEHELTNALLKADQYEPVLMHLPFVLQQGMDVYELTLADLKHNRTTILQKTIEAIAAASTTYDSQTVHPYALQPAEMVDLLKLMMNTMKNIQSSLGRGSEERNEYEVMIYKLAETMDRHVNSLVPLERWLKDTDTIMFSRHTDRKRFGGALPATGILIIPKQEVMWFQVICQKAAVQGTQDQIYQVLHDVYSDTSDVFETEWYQPKMLAMMQQVFPAYLEVALTENGALVGAPVVRSLVSICNNIFMRAVNVQEYDPSQLLDALYATIASARIAMQRSSAGRAVASLLNSPGLLLQYFETALEPTDTLTLAFTRVLRIARISSLQYQEVVRCASLPRTELSRISCHTHYIFQVVRALQLHLKEGDEGHWSELDEIPSLHLSDPEANIVKQFAAEALEKGLRSDWSMDSSGNWWVKQGRDAVRVNGDSAAKIPGMGLRTQLEAEMQAYMDMYEGITRGVVMEVFMSASLEANLRNLNDSEA